MNQWYKLNIYLYAKVFIISWTLLQKNHEHVIQKENSLSIECVLKTPKDNIKKLNYWFYNEQIIIVKLMFEI